MVLSNKKLKQKLRAEVSQSLSASVAKPVVNGDASENRSLKELLGSSTLRPRFSKREKRRKTLSLVDSDEKKDGEEKEGESHSVVETQSKKGKGKRKRDYQKDEEDGVSNMVENGEAKQPKKNNKKKKKKKNKKKKTTKNEEGNKKDEVTSEEEHGVSVANKNIESQANGDGGVKVYVGGIPYYSTEDDIRSYFESCGTIAEVDCMKFPETGKFRGIAILTFKMEAAAKRALEMDGSDMCGFFLTLQPYKSTRSDKALDFSPQMVEGYNRVYLGNLSWDITEDAIRDFFSGCGISSIRFGTDKETGEFKGFAHVDFSNSASLKIALKLDQGIVCGRPVKIRCAVPAKGSKINPRSESVPKESKINPISDAVPKESKINPISEPVLENSQPEDAPTVPIVSGKIRRRTCYECGEKGHLSTACPKKQSGDSNPK